LEFGANAGPPAWRQDDKMTRSVGLPGSGRQELDEVGFSGGGRLSADEIDTLSEVVRWWRHRRAVGDSADPLETAFGGVDERHTVRTVGLLPVAVAFPKPLLVGRGAGYLIHALGLPGDAAVGGEVYSLVGLGHFYRDPLAGVLSRHETVGRAPFWITTTEVRTAVSGSPPNQVPAIQLVGAAGETIDWTVEVYRLEVVA
jgi:hypothetical protein